MWFRLAFVVPLVLAGVPAVAAPAKGPTAGPSAAAAKAPPAARDGLSPARERQRACGAEWRALAPSEKAARGPAWPQFYSKCVKRLKSGKP